MKPVVLFDIDSTLLNSAKIHTFTARHLIRKFNKADLHALGYLLFGRPRGFLDSPAVEKSFLAPEYYRKSLFEDVLPVLKKLKRKAILGVFSQGPGRLQRAKLRLSGVERYFEREFTFVFPPRKVGKARQVIAGLPKTKIYFVDDRLDIAETLANHRVQVFLIRRNPRLVTQNGRVTVIRSLKEILAFLP